MNEEKIREIAALEEELAFLIRPGMTIDEKLKALDDSHWRAWNTGYCDYMAGKLMSGIEDEQTDCWEFDCRHKYDVDRLYGLLKEMKEEIK
ncbi:MAG: hypothetical protein J6S71_01345 [Clostridia bacterium]|nr:hypothetical protein [Clostridia bacterium]